MRIRSIEFFINQIGSENNKIQGPKNKEEELNLEIAEYFFAKNKKQAA